MRDLICNTSPIQYLHQLGLLSLLPSLAGSVIVPDAVEQEIRRGIAASVNLPDLAALSWIDVRPTGTIDECVLAKGLGLGESAVIQVGLATPQAVVMLDDRPGRLAAVSLGLAITGTIGLLLDAKSKQLIADIKTYLDRLESLRFRLAEQTRMDALRRAGEIP